MYIRKCASFSTHLVCTMGEVQTGNIHASFDHFLQLGDCVTRGTCKNRWQREAKGTAKTITHKPAAAKSLLQREAMGTARNNHTQTSKNALPEGGYRKSYKQSQSCRRNVPTEGGYWKSLGHSETQFKARLLDWLVQLFQREGNWIAMKTLTQNCPCLASVTEFLDHPNKEVNQRNKCFAQH